MRAKGRVDSNHAEIVRALRINGAVVQSLAPIGNGCPDLLVAYRGANWLLEIKRDDKARLTADERKWHEDWRGQGQVAIVTSWNEALYVIGAMEPPKGWKPRTEDE